MCALVEREAWENFKITRITCVGAIIEIAVRAKFSMFFLCHCSVVGGESESLISIRIEMLWLRACNERFHEKQLDSVFRGFIYFMSLRTFLKLLEFP